MNNIFQDFFTIIWQLIAPLISAFSPLLIGLALAYFLRPAVDWLSPKVGSVKAILLTYFAFFSAAAALTGGFVILILGALPTGNLHDTITLIADYFEEAYSTAADFLNRWLPSKLSAPSHAAEELQSWISRFFSVRSLTSLISSISGIAVSLLLGIVASVYLLKDREYFLLLRDRFLSLIFTQRTHGIICEIMSETNGVISAFLKGALIDGIIVAFLSSAVLSLLQVDYAVIIGTVGGILNIIPYFGPFIGMLPAFLIAFFTDGIAKSAAAVASLFLVQQLDSNYIYPRVVGNSTGLHPLFILLAVSVCGYFFGLAGMLLAVPAAGVMQVLIRRWAYK